jgi:DNA polymerase III epsilon subunit-like protein
MRHDAPLRGLPVAVIDVETTGLDPEVDHIIEVAVVHLQLGRNEPTVAFRSRVKPPVPVPEKITELTGITDADLVGAPTWREIRVRLGYALESRALAAYNAPFDYRFLAAEEARCGARGPAWPWIDARVPAEVVDKYKSGKRLVDVAGRRGITLDAHGAVADATATALLLHPLLREAWAAREDGFRGSTLGDLHTWQRVNALRREVEFTAYCRKNGRTRPSCPWHELEGREPPPWPEPERASTHVDADGVVHRREA